MKETFNKIKAKVQSVVDSMRAKWAAQPMANKILFSVGATLALFVVIIF